MSGVEHDMLRIGRIMAADQGLMVECRGMLAHASPGKVTLPSLENLDYLGPDAERMMHGYLDHECAHASDTDFTLYKRAREEHGEAFQKLLNAVEDGYIEARQGTRYRGAKWNLEQKNTWFWERKDEDGKSISDFFTDPTCDPWRRFLLATTLCVRPWGGRVPADFKVMDPETYGRLQLCTTELAAVGALTATPHATQQCWNIAKVIFDRFAAPMSLASWTGEAPSPEQAIEAELLSVLAGEDLGKDCDYDGQPIQKAEGAGHDDARPRGTKPYIVFSHEYDHEIDVSGDVYVSDKYESLVQETSIAADAFTFAFEAALRARRAKGLVYGCDEGDVDPQALVEYAVGVETADRLYTQRFAEEDDDDVAVSVLIDCSGSMGAYDHSFSKSRLAAQTATAIHRACAACQIEHEIGGFTTCGWSGGSLRPHLIWQVDDAKLRLAKKHLLEAWQEGQDPRLFARIFQGGDPSQLTGERPPLLVPSYAIFKSFVSTDARGISHIDGISENLDGEAVLWAARRLAARPERRRVLFVLSDGYPSAARHETDDAGYLRETVHRAIEAGIEVYGIGIQSAAVEEFYPISWVVRKLADLPGIALGALTDVLARNRKEQAWVTI